MAHELESHPSMISSSDTRKAIKLPSPFKPIVMLGRCDGGGGRGGGGGGTGMINDDGRQPYKDTPTSLIALLKSSVLEIGLKS